MDPTRKQLHEQFVSNLNGTTPTEVLALSLVLPLSSGLIKILSLTSLLNSSGTETLILLLPLLFCITFWNNYVYEVCIILLVVNFVLIAMLWPSESFALFQKETWFDRLYSRWKAILGVPMVLPLQKLPFISEHRSSLLLDTCLCILAVDFPIFPRRFAKTETYGWGCMDTGVGVFVVINATTSPEVSDTSRQSRFVNIWKSFKSSIPLIIIGVIRVLTVKATDYHVHTSEYGVYWNFFFTLAVTKIVSSCVALCFPSPLLFSLVPWILIIVHQILLYSTGAPLILNDDRQGLFMANKEGILSLGGYLSLYLLFIGYGRVIRQERSSVKEWASLVRYLILHGIVAWIFMLVVHHYIQEVSRRMANLGYFLFMLSLNLLFLGCVLTIDIIVRILKIGKTEFKGLTERGIVLLEAVNYNALPFFLACNVLTGIINISFDTIHATPSISLLILSSYTGTLCVLSIFLYRLRIKLINV